MVGSGLVVMYFRKFRYVEDLHLARFQQQDKEKWESKHLLLPIHFFW